MADGRVRYRVIIEDDPSEPGTDETRYRQHEFLAHLAVNDWLLACGPVMYEQLTVRHDGERWVAEAQATVSNRG